MKLSYLFYALFIHGATAAVIRKLPAFATPVYSDSYLPASMQVIFHVVEQLKRLETEEIEENLLMTPSTSPHPPGQRQPLIIETIVDTLDDVKTTTLLDEEKYDDPPEKYQEEALIFVKSPGVNEDKIFVSDVTPESNQEESEMVYGVPETNYELPESNHEEPEEGGVNFSQENKEITETKPVGTCKDYETLKNVEKSTVDDVVKEIYSIIETSSTIGKNISTDSESSLSSSSEEKIIEPSTSGSECPEGKNSPGGNLSAEEETSEDKERSDELKDDKRFTLLGEKVDQVPSPSLVAFLRAGNATSNPSLRQLGELYDALSRDARRQGLSKFSGYSDTVLKFLQESSGGGAGVQLKELLEKTVAKKELTRYDAMEKTNDILKTLNDSASKLNTDLRRLLPLRFLP